MFFPKCLIKMDSTYVKTAPTLRRRTAMVTKSKKQNGGKKEQGRVKVGKLKLNKETLNDLSASGKKQIKGGAIRAGSCHQVLSCYEK